MRLNKIKHLISDDVEEEWGLIDEYSDFYVSNMGRLIKPYKNGVLKVFESVSSPKNYATVGYFTNGKEKKYTVHILVAKSFVKNPLNKPQVNHINGIRNDNRADNLEWVTVKENVIHAYRTGIKKPRYPKIVFNYLTGIFYESLKDAAFSIGTSCRNLSYHLGNSGKYKDLEDLTNA
jgi:hypothetical protein